MLHINIGLQNSGLMFRWNSWTFCPPWVVATSLSGGLPLFQIVQLIRFIYVVLGETKNLCGYYSVLWPAYYASPL